MRLPFKIVRNPKVPKIERTLKLEHFFTFKNGHKIYTYKLEDLAKVSGRYLDQIKNTVNFMIQYNSSPEQVNTFCAKIEQFALTGIKALSMQDKDKMLLDISKYASEMPKLSAYVEDLEKKMWHDLYVMFFCLDTEPELAFTPKQNALKIEYLETCTEEEQERFFFYLKELMISFSSTYKEDMLNSLVMEGQRQNLMDSLLNPIKGLSSISKLQNMEE